MVSRNKPVKLKRIKQESILNIHDGFKLQKISETNIIII